MGFGSFFKKASGNLNPSNLLGGADKFLMGTDYSKKQKKDLEAVTGPLGQQIASAKGASKASLMKALQSIEGGFGRAGESLAMQGALGSKAILDRERVAQGNNVQSMMNRGMYGTTVTDSVNRGITSDTNQSLSQLQSMLAQIGSNIEIGRGQAIAGAYGDLAGVDQNYSQLMLSLGLGKLSATQNVQYGKQGGALPGILNIAGQVAGKAMI